MRSLLAITLLFSACSKPPEPDNTNTNNTTGGSEDPAPCVERGPAAVAEGLDGRWYVLEVDDEDVELVVELHGDTGVAWEDAMDDAERASVQVERRDDGLVELVLASPGSTETINILWAQRGPSSAIAFITGDDDARIARRAGPLPAFLRGTWQMEEPGRPDRIMDVVVDGEQIRIVREGEPMNGTVHGLASEGPGHDVVVSMERNGRERMAWLRFIPVNDDVLLVLSGGDDEYRVVYRPGHRPGWLEAARPPRPQIDPIPG